MNQHLPQMVLCHLMVVPQTETSKSLPDFIMAVLRNDKERIHNHYAT
jgi:hypothetical protein